MGFIKRETVQEAPGSDRREATRDCDGLRAQLAGPSAAVRRLAVRDLRNCPDASADILARLQVESDHSVREAILQALTFIGDDIAIGGLLDCLHSENVELRNGAIEAMKSLPGRVAPIMSAMLCDGDSDARIFAVNVLESLRHPDVEAWLLTVIEQDPHVNVCSAAVDLLCEIATPAAKAPLEALKARFPDEPYIQFAANLAVSRLGDG